MNSRQKQEQDAAKMIDALADKLEELALAASHQGVTAVQAYEAGQLVEEARHWTSLAR